MKFIAVLCFLTPASVLAQADLSDSTHLLDEVVVSASKMPELRTKIPQQVHVISASQIRRLNIQTTADLIAGSGTVAVQKSQQAEEVLNFLALKRAGIFFTFRMRI